ncbi:MAG: hypothetical protein HND52_16295 [Ignavibacteriae bacterium]|nr:hypothetical protein [Ignavibacteriota bacterium]NOG99518.1 hypothetical protein [Ignavibacteriota bacterium]
MKNKNDDLKIPRAFLSFDLEYNLDDKIHFINEIVNSTVKFAVRSWSTPFTRPTFLWTKKVKEKILRCNFAVVIVDEFTHESQNVLREIHIAQKNSIPIFGVYIPGIRASCKLPPGLLRERTIKWNWTLIGTAVTFVMKNETDKWEQLR